MFPRTSRAKMRVISPKTRFFKFRKKFLAIYIQD